MEVYLVFAMRVKVYMVMDVLAGHVFEPRSERVVKTYPRPAESGVANRNASFFTVYFSDRFRGTERETLLEAARLFLTVSVLSLVRVTCT